MFVLQKMMRRQNADDPEQISVNGSLRFVTMIVTMPIMMIIIFMSWNLYLLISISMSHMASGHWPLASKSMTSVSINIEHVDFRSLSVHSYPVTTQTSL